MKNGKVGLRAAPNSLMRIFQGKAGPGPIIQTDSGGPAVSKFAASGRFVQVFGWMLLGLIVAGPNLPSLHSQDSRLARVNDAKSKESPAEREATPAKESKQLSPPQKAVQPDIVLPDIYISIPAPAEASEPAVQNHSPVDTTTLKQRLQKAEGELESLQHERTRLMKNLEQMKTRPVKGANRPVGQKTELLERPSV
jgi:hypothetical protein